MGKKFESKRFSSVKERDAFKKKVRASKEWKALRTLLFERQKGLDPITGKKLRKGFVVHHLCVNNDFYSDLNPEYFIALNKKTHEMLHFLYDNFLAYCLNKNVITDLLTKMRVLSSREWNGGESIDRPEILDSYERKTVF